MTPAAFFSTISVTMWVSEYLVSVTLMSSLPLVSLMMRSVTRLPLIMRLMGAEMTEPSVCTTDPSLAPAPVASVPGLKSAAVLSE